jgi:hypothetical protein
MGTSSLPSDIIIADIDHVIVSAPQSFGLFASEQHAFNALRWP